MMPATIKVGYRDYQVIDWSQAEGTAADAYGDFDRLSGVIHVRDDMPAAFTAEILLHEVLHAAYEMGELTAGDGEERIVSVFAKHLMQIIRDNPDLITYLNGANGNG